MEINQDEVYSLNEEIKIEKEHHQVTQKGLNTLRGELAETKQDLYKSNIELEGSKNNALKYQELNENLIKETAFEKLRWEKIINSLQKEAERNR